VLGKTEQAVRELEGITGLSLVDGNGNGKAKL
jgi:hypothetical protein